MPIIKNGDVIYLNFDHPSFLWNNGLWIVINVDEKEKTLHLCHFDKKGNPSRFDDGRYMCSVTGLNNKAIEPTKLRYELEDNYTFL